MGTGDSLDGLVRLSRALDGMLASLLERGREFPFHFVALAHNGASLSGRVVRSPEDGVEPIWDVDDVPDAGLQFPIHLVWLDSEGAEAVYMEVDSRGATKCLN